MSKKISKYKLLGLIKDGKKPVKIKFCDDIYNYRIDENDYYNKKAGYLFNSDGALTNNLKDEVEILNEIEYRKDKITVVKNLEKYDYIPAGAYGILLDSSHTPYVSWFNHYKFTYDLYIRNKTYKNVWAVPLDNLELVSEIDKGE